MNAAAVSSPAVAARGVIETPLIRSLPTVSEMLPPLSDRAERGEDPDEKGRPHRWHGVRTDRRGEGRGSSTTLRAPTPSRGSRSPRRRRSTGRDRRPSSTYSGVDARRYPVALRGVPTPHRARRGLRPGSALSVALVERSHYRLVIYPRCSKPYRLRNTGEPTSEVVESASSRDRSDSKRPMSEPSQNGI